MLLADPDPTLEANKALALYEPSYPHLASCKLGEPEVVGDKLVFPVDKPVVETKG